MIQRAVTFLVIGLTLFPCCLRGQQFRIETEVYRADNDELISENLTLFDGSLIYDFMLRTDRTRFPKEIAIFNSSTERFVLLDIDRKVKSEVMSAQLLKLLMALRTSSQQKANSFFFNPKFDENYDFGTGWLTLSSDQMTYRTRGERPKDEMVLHKYYEFIEQFSRLNATHPRRMPPFARMELNQAIKKYGFIPDQVELTMTPDDRPEPIVVRTKHVLMLELSDNDRKKIESTKRYWTSFKNVKMAEFREIEPQNETHSPAERQIDGRDESGK